MIDFQDDGHGGHLEFPIGTVLTIFDLQVVPIFPTKSIGLSFQEKTLSFIFYFYPGGHLIDWRRTILVESHTGNIPVAQGRKRNYHLRRQLVQCGLLKPRQLSKNFHPILIIHVFTSKRPVCQNLSNRVYSFAVLHSL